MKKLIVIFAALAMLVAAVPASAQEKADWAFYGSARMWTSWESVDEETILGGNSGSRAKAWYPGFNLDVQDDSDLDWRLQTNSRFGANVKWGNIGGTVELGDRPAPTAQFGDDFAASWRLLYGTWNFGPGTLLVGKAYTPYFFLVSGLCGPAGGECNGIGFGSIYGGRRAQIGLQFGGFKVALIEPATTLPIDSNTLVVTPTSIGVGSFGATADVDQQLPKIEASYTFNLGPAALFLGGFYNTYDLEFGTATGVKDTSVDSFGFGIGARTAFGPLYVNATGQYGRNVANAAMPTTLLLSRMVIDGATLDEEDADYMAAQLILGFKVMDSLAFEGGVVWQSADLDVDDGSVEQDMWVYYIQAVWSPAKNVSIVPEFGIIKNGDLKATDIDDIDLGKVTWFGIKWQINF